MDHNFVKEIPDWIEGFTRLKTLSLSNNNISRITPNIGNLAGSLIYLNLGNNRFKTIPKEVFNCVQLIGLHIYNNHFTSIPVQLSHLLKLKEFSLDWLEYCLPPI